jgi:outer membrane protein assembly factor BamB
VTITVVCPECLSLWHVKPETRGKRMRCPNPTCGEVFVAAELGPPPPPAAEAPSVAPRPNGRGDGERVAPARPNYVTGNVASMLEVVPADDPPPAAGPRELDWASMPPPPVQAAAPAEVPPPPKPAPRKAADPPPPAVEAAPPPPPADEPSADEEEVTPAPPRHGGRKLLLAAILAVPAVVLLGGGVLGFWMWAHSEDRWAARAWDAYESRRFGKAAEDYDGLARNFVTSGYRNKYTFLRDLSKARGAVQDVVPGNDPHPPLEEMLKFLDDPNTDAELREQYTADVADTLRKSAEDHAAAAEAGLDQTAVAKGGPEELARARESIGQIRARLAQLEQIERELRRFAPKNDPGELTQLARETRDKARDRVDLQERRADALEELAAVLTKPPSYAKVEKAEAKARARALADDAVVKAVIDAARDEVTRTVRYLPDLPPLPAATTLPEGPPGLLYAPPVSPAPGVPGLTGPVVFAAANGVLYALDAEYGRIRWATRVGPDADRLPVRVPADETDREAVLVVSADGTGLTARDAATGTLRWHQKLGGTCLGSPVLIDRRVFVPLRSSEGGRGVVAEYEVKGGARLGRIELGQPLSAGAARQANTYRLFVPAEQGTVYVLNADPYNPATRENPLLAALATGHPAGSLRAEPLVVGDEPAPPGAVVPPGPAYLVLAQNDGLRAMTLKAFPLTQPPLPEPPSLGGAPLSVRLDGWAWSAPFSDNEKLALVTDAGEFALLGVNQPGNTDSPLFRLPGVPSHGSSAPGRGQVVHAAENDFWAVAAGRLQLFRLGLHPRDGLTLAPAWRAAVPVGTPLHAGQSLADMGLLVVASRAAGTGAALATAVEAATGKVRWQCKLGLNCLRDPVVVGGKVVALDQSGALVIDDPAKRPPSDAEWRTGSEAVIPPPANAVGEPHLLVEPDGKAVWRVSVSETPGGRRVHARRYPPAGDDVEHSAPLSASLAGPPVLVGKSLILPMDDGSLRRWVLDPPAEIVVERGTWRHFRLGRETPAYVAALGPDECVAYNGYRTLHRWSLLDNQKSTDVQLPGPLTGPLVPVPRGGRAAVATTDAEGRLVLLDGTSFQRQGQWPLGGPLTAGPFVRHGPGGAVRIGVVVNRKELLWIDPDTPRQPLWRYATDGQGLVGRPQFDGDTLLVADAAGTVVRLDAGTGTPTGPPLRLPAALVPDATPAAFGADRLFAPLTDGTVLLLPRGAKAVAGGTSQ